MIDFFFFFSLMHILKNIFVQIFLLFNCFYLFKYVKTDSVFISVSEIVSSNKKGKWDTCCITNIIKETETYLNGCHTSI